MRVLNLSLINEHAYDRVDDLMTTFIEDDKYKIVYGGNTSLNGRFIVNQPRY